MEIEIPIDITLEDRERYRRAGLSIIKILRDELRGPTESLYLLHEIIGSIEESVGATGSKVEHRPSPTATSGGHA